MLKYTYSKISYIIHAGWNIQKCLTTTKYWFGNNLSRFSLLNLLYSQYFSITLEKKSYLHNKFIIQSELAITSVLNITYSNGWSKN